jgi:hypothetical protein
MTNLEKRVIRALAVSIMNASCYVNIEHWARRIIAILDGEQPTEQERREAKRV